MLASAVYLSIIIIMPVPTGSRLVSARFRFGNVSNGIPFPTGVRLVIAKNSQSGPDFRQGLGPDWLCFSGSRLGPDWYKWCLVIQSNCYKNRADAAALPAMIPSAPHLS